MFVFLTVVQAIVAALLVLVILLQKSEGGGLGVGGSPSGLMSARGAADLLTRTTAILATLFVALSITLAALAVQMGGVHKFDNSLNRAAQTAPAPKAPMDPLAAPSAAVAPGASASASAPADPLALPSKK